MFSVLMSVYSNEQAECLQQALESVFNQTLPPDEVVLVEDGPLTDALYEVVNTLERQHPQLKVLALPENKGLGLALNAGLNCCSHNIVVRMDSDDISLPKRFEKIIRVVEDNEEIAVVGSWIDEFVGNTDNVIAQRIVPEKHEDIYLYGKTRNPMNHVSVAFRKDKVMLAGGYQHFPLFEDYYLWVRMLVANFRFYNLQESLVLVRIGNDMYRRRGGWRYAKTEVQFQKVLLEMGYINVVRFLFNLVLRGIPRIVPNYFRATLYRFLRKPTMGQPKKIICPQTFE